MVINHTEAFLCGSKHFPVGKKTYLVGVLNITSDSFSGDGLLLERDPVAAALSLAKQMVEQGADLVDVGGESSQPGARPISEEEEARRVLPVVTALARQLQIPISVDTYKPSIADEALKRGASMINDITGLQRDSRMASVIARHQASVVIMHMKGTPQTMQANPSYQNLITEILQFFRESLQRALKAGIDRRRMLLDPGIGFGKSVEQNLEILRRLDEFLELGFPILVGTSRKSFIGRVLNRPLEERLFGTAATISLAVSKGASFLRVHDVKAMADVARMTEAILLTP